MKEKTTSQKESKKILLLIIGAIVLICAVLSIWYFAYKKPHDQAIATYTSTVESYNNFVPEYNAIVSAYNDAINSIASQNQELDNVIDSAQSAVDSGIQPYDETTLDNLKSAIEDSKNSKVQLPDSATEIKKLSISSDDTKASTKDLNEQSKAVNSDISNLESQAANLESEMQSLITPVDYSSQISILQENQKIYENSVKIQEQITSPSEDFVIECLKKISSIKDIQAVTEDHDPNGNLNKAGGYTASVYFEHSHIDLSSVYGSDLIEKGTDAGGCIEVYANVDDAEKRNTYLASFDGSVLASGSHTVLGTMVIRTSNELTASQQKELEKNIIEKFLEL